MTSLTHRAQGVHSATYTSLQETNNIWEASPQRGVMEPKRVSRYLWLDQVSADLLAVRAEVL